jgi:dTDP-glucose 4,6-dehydratase
LEIKIARCYAIVGPHLPLDTHFAAGNFLGDALAGRTIRIASDGSSVRSYLYASDLAIWLWTILFRAPSMRAYNVGSEDAVTIRELAAITMRAVNPAITVEVAQPIDPARVPHRYVPSTARARDELGLLQTVSLGDGLRRTAAWHQLES